METNKQIIKRDNKNIVIMESNKIGYDEFLKSIGKEEKEVKK